MKPQLQNFRIGFAGDLNSQRGELVAGRDFHL